MQQDKVIKFISPSGLDKDRGGKSLRFLIRKIFQLNPELGLKCSEITNKMFIRTKHPYTGIESNQFMLIL